MSNINDLDVSGKLFNYKVTIKGNNYDKYEKDDIINDLYSALYELKFSDLYKESHWSSDESSSFEESYSSGLSDPSDSKYDSNIPDSTETDASSLTLNSSRDSQFEKLKENIKKHALLNELGIESISNPIDTCMKYFIKYDNESFAEWLQNNLENYILHEITLKKEEFMSNLIGFAYKYQYNPLNTDSKENIIWFVYGRSNVAAYILAKYSNFHFNKQIAWVKIINKNELPAKSSLFTLVDEVYL